MSVTGGGDQARSTASAATRGGSGAAVSIDDVVHAAIELAGDALRRRVLLQAIDWTRIAADRVAAMLDGLERSRQRLPLWLARALLTAGHVLPETMAEPLARELRVLNVLNAKAAGRPSPHVLQASDIETLRLDESIDPDVVRALANRLAATGMPAEACRLALSRLADAPSALQAVRAVLPPYVAALPAARLCVAAFSTTDVLCEDLKVACAAMGFGATVEHAAFGEVIATLLSPREDADAHVLLLDAAMLLDRDWRLGSGESLSAVTGWIDQICGAVRAYAARTPKPLLVNTLAVPAVPTAGFIDAGHALGLRRAVDLVNGKLLALAREVTGLVLVDADQALAHIAPAQRTDAKLWYYGRVAYSAEASRALAVGFARAFAATRRAPAKVLAIDFDNTLWGGVYGDDGVERLVCGEEAPGNAFQAFQRECLRLKRQGMLLVGLSKNNADAIDVFAKHPGMLLRQGDFAATAINWQPKPENLRALAAELRLGLDSFVFLDDSPHEREAMRRLLPQVIVPEMPADPALRPEWLRRIPATWPLRLTEEDEQRSDFYAAEAQAKALKATAATMADYLAGLEQQLVISGVTPASLARAAQMHQRTNQFNLTTRRSTEAEIAGLAQDPDRGLALLGRVRDKFGDHGLTVAATATIAGSEAEIATFLMSCRVIGREIERAFLGALLGELAKRGVRRIAGRYIATPKNAMSRDLYKANGFRLLSESAEGSAWEFNIGVDEIPASPYVSVTLEG